MSDREEKKNQRISLLTSVGIHFSLLVLFLFGIGWKAPDPPLSAYGSGVELNFGLDSEGTGDIQPVVPAGSEAVTPVKAVESEKQTAKEESRVEEEKKEQPPVENTKVESNLTGQEDSPVEVKENKKEIKKVEPPREKPKEKKEVTPKPVTKDNGKSDNDVVTKKVEADGAKKAGAKGEGDDKNKAGDKGSPEGTLDPNGQYTGKPGVGGAGSGGGNGFALSMAGWNWDEQPEPPKLPDNVNGRIVFEIEVDANGDITKINTLERGLSPEAEKLCKDEIRKRSLVRTDGSAAPEHSRGKITFILKTR